MQKLFMILLLLVNIIYAKTVVTTTIYPLYSIVKEVGGDNVKLNNLIPFGTEAHEFEPTPNDIVTLTKSDLFLYSSSIMEPWSEKLIKSNNLQDRSINMSKFVTVKVHKEYEDGKTIDPHYWLSFDNYLKMINKIEYLLSQKDPSNSAIYKKNAASYTKKVKALQAKYESLKTCKNKKVIVNHDAFGYLADDYGITQYSIAGMSPDEQPSAKQIAQLIDLVKKENIHTVFFEEFASDKIAKTIATESGAKSDELSPAENLTKEDNAKGVNYLDVLSEDLVKLKGAMDCQ